MVDIVKLIWLGTSMDVNVLWYFKILFWIQFGPLEIWSLFWSFALSVPLEHTLFHCQYKPHAYFYYVVPLPPGLGQCPHGCGQTSQYATERLRVGKSLELYWDLVSPLCHVTASLCGPLDICLHLLLKRRLLGLSWLLCWCSLEILQSAAALMYVLPTQEWLSWSDWCLIAKNHISCLNFVFSSKEKAKFPFTSAFSDAKSYLA